MPLDDSPAATQVIVIQGGLGYTVSQVFRSHFASCPHADSFRNQQTAMLAAFLRLGVTESALTAFVKKPLSQLSAAEIDELRGIHAAIDTGEASWEEYVAGEGPGQDGSRTEDERGR